MLIGTARYGYDTTTGEITTITDALSNVTTFGYDANGDMTSEDTPDGYNQSWLFNGANQVDRFTNKSGVVEATTYDAYGRGLVNTVTEASGTAVAAITTDSYDNAGQLIAVEDAVGNVTQYTLDAMGQTVLTTDGSGNSSRSVYDLDGNLTDSFDATGAHTHNTYSNRGWMTATIDPMGNVTSYTHDADGNVTEVEDPLTNVTTIGYTVLNQVATVTNPLSETTTTAYWGDGAVKSVTDPMGYVTSTTTDLSTKEITTTAAAGTGVAETTTQYLNADGQVIATENALSETTTVTLNSMGEETASTNPLSQVTTMTLDAMGNPTAVTDPRGYVTSYTLNALEQTTAMTDPTGDTTQYVLDALGQTVATINGAGDTSTNVYSPEGNTIVMTDADGNPVHAQFDAAGRQVTFTDSDGNTTTWEYDRDGNKIAEIDPNGGTITWTYNGDNQVTATIDQLGRTDTYSYNAGGELTTELWKNSGGTTVNTLTFTSNADGQQLTAGDDNGTYTYTYDALGRMTSQEDIWGLTLSFGYDNGNNLTSETDSLGGTVTNTYDAAGELTEKQFSDTGGDALSIGYTYNADGEVTVAKRYSDATETTLIGQTDYGYDNADRVTSIADKNAAGTSTLDSYTYTFNSAGEVATVTSTLGPSATYSYDADGQILSDGTNNYTYDSEGNRTGTGYVTNTGNELASDGTWSYTYNAVGNMIQKTNISTGQIWLYTYDNANQLVEVQRKESSGGAVDLQVNYTYDVLGNRISESVNPDGAGPDSAVLTKFAYDPNGNVWANLTSTGTLITRRIYGDATDALIARIDSNGVSWYLTDNLGSIRDITNSTGSIIDHRDYDVFGNMTYESAQTYGDRYGFTGREFDTITGLQDNRAQVVQSRDGTVDRQDPMGFGAGDSDLYRYVQNDTANATDPTGLEVTWYKPWTWLDFLSGAPPVEDPGSYAGASSPPGAQPTYNPIESNSAYGRPSQPPTVNQPRFIIGPAPSPYMYSPEWADLNMAPTPIRRDNWDIVIPEIVGQQMDRLFLPHSGVFWQGLNSGGLGYLAQPTELLPVTVVTTRAGGSTQIPITNELPSSGNLFIVSQRRVIVPVPAGATGPIPVVNPGGRTTGFSFANGSGGSGLNSRVTSVRIMDPTLPSGPSPGYPYGYSLYQNAGGQGVNPFTGATIGNADPMRHISLGP